MGCSKSLTSGQRALERLEQLAVDLGEQQGVAAKIEEAVLHADASRFRTSHQISASRVSSVVWARPTGPRRAAVGAGSARWSTLPLRFSGSASMNTYADGSM